MNTTLSSTVPAPMRSSDAPAAILATAVVPWTEDYELDEPVFRREVHAIASGLTNHIYVFGTAGEGYAVSERQFEAVARAFLSNAREVAAVPMLGIISLSLPTIIERIGLGHALGYRCFQLSLPAWGALNDTELDTFFRETCGRFLDCEFHHYNVVRARRLLTSKDYLRLAANNPNLVGVKAATDDAALIADLLTVSDRLRFFLPETGYALARRTHNVGLLISHLMIDYARARAFVTGSDADRDATLADLHVLGAALHSVASTRFHMDSAFDKLLVRFTDPAFPLRLLAPYAGPTDEDFVRLRAALPLTFRSQK